MCRQCDRWHGIPSIERDDVFVVGQRVCVRWQMREALPATADTEDLVAELGLGCPVGDALDDAVETGNVAAAGQDPEFARQPWPPPVGPTGVCQVLGPVSIIAPGAGAGLSGAWARTARGPSRAGGPVPRLARRRSSHQEPGPAYPAPGPGQHGARLAPGAPSRAWPGVDHRTRSRARGPSGAWPFSAGARSAPGARFAARRSPARAWHRPGGRKAGHSTRIAARGPRSAPDRTAGRRSLSWPGYLHRESQFARRFLAGSSDDAVMRPRWLVRSTRREERRGRRTSAQRAPPALGEPAAEARAGAGEPASRRRCAR